MKREWNTTGTIPTKDGDYEVIVKMVGMSKEEEKYYAVRNDDLVYDVDYFCDRDFERYPQIDNTKNGYWKVVAWREINIDTNDLPEEYKDAVKWENLPKREFIQRGCKL